MVGSGIMEKRPPVTGKASINKQKKDAPFFTKFLLFCGILSSLYYVMMNVVVPPYFPGYNMASQTVSELSAINAPSRPLWVSLALYYSVLVMVFGWGIWRSSVQSRSLKIVSVLMLVFGASGFFWPPMHLRGEAFTQTDLMHIIFASVSVLLMLVMIILGAASFGRGFRRFSFFTVAMFLVFGTLTAMDSPNIAADLRTPWIGVWERINIGVWLVWVMVFSVVLMQRNKNQLRQTLILGASDPVKVDERIYRAKAN